VVRGTVERPVHGEAEEVGEAERGNGGARVLGGGGGKAEGVGRVCGAN
jgi:hypothetical protein